MYYLVLVLVWLSGVTCGIVAALVLRVYWETQGVRREMCDAHERVAWAEARGR